MELLKMSIDMLLSLITSVSEREEELKYEAVREERYRIARDLKERNYLQEDIAKITKLDLTEVELLKVCRLKELLHYRLRVEEELRSELNGVTKNEQEKETE